MAERGKPEEVQRWTAKRRAALVLSILKKEATAAEAVRRHGLKSVEVGRWCNHFMIGAENALRARPKGEDAWCEYALREQKVDRLKRKVAELTIELDIAREVLREGRSAPETPED